MEASFILVLLISLCLCVFLTTLLFSSRSSKTHRPLPPGPLRVPIIGSVLWLRRSFTELQPILRSLRAKYGPIVTLPIGSVPAIFISDRSLAHQALVQNGAVFSDRPKSLATSKVVNSNQHSITSAFYGPTWRLLRRNLTSEILHTTRIKSFSGTRQWVLETLLNRLKSDSESGNPIKVVDHLQYAMFCLLVFMCFGERIDEEEIKDIERVQRRYLLNFDRFNVLNFWPRVTRFLLHKRWEELLQIRKEQEDVLIPLIRARKKAMEDKDSSVVSYVDSLLDLEWPEEKRKLDDGEMVSLCSEFVNAGTDTMSTALQWIMANLVKYSHFQDKIVEEIRGVMGDREESEQGLVREEDLNKLPYLKAVILEGLRRHPPAHFVLPHAVSEDVMFNGYLVPKEGTVNFMVAEMGWDPEVWEDPMEFKPERFFNGGEGFDITGSKEIKMMPFGAGRRMCPGYNLAMLLLEYFVANLIWKFQWKAPNGGDVDLSEREEFTVVMENPLQGDVLIPLLRTRKISKEERLNKGREDNSPDEDIGTYLDTLLDLEWPKEKRKLLESEIVMVCSEFLNAGADTTATALQWIMANLVKYPHIQRRVAEEIREVMGDREEKEVKDEDLNNLPYLKAVILEGLRRHPPGHFLLPHAISEDVVLNDYLVPKNGSINFMVAEMGWDPKVWENPMEFKPERFLNGKKNGDEGFDITGSKEIKMMPFGAGRRMCPGYNLAMLHLEYFVANLAWNFEWKASNGVDLSEKQEFTVVMKNPIPVHISPRL